MCPDNKQPYTVTVWVPNGHQLKGPWEGSMSKTGPPIVLALFTWALVYFIFYMNLVARENQVVSDQERELTTGQFRRQESHQSIACGQCHKGKMQERWPILSFKYCFPVDLRLTNMAILWAEIELEALSQTSESGLHRVHWHGMQSVHICVCVCFMDA